MSKMTIEQSNEHISSVSGVALIAPRLNDYFNALHDFDNTHTGRTKRGFFRNSEILKIAVVQAALGNSDFTDVNLRRNDLLYREALELKRLPSEEIYRQRLDAIAAFSDYRTVVDNLVVAQLNRIKDFGMIRTPYGKYCPLDIDVSVMENSCGCKEGTGYTYKGVVGYAPIFCTIGLYGYQLANELREGTQHSQKGAVEFLQRCINLAVRLGIPRTKLLVRVDSGHDSGEFIAALEELGVKYIVKRNLRQEDPEQYLDLAKAVGDKVPNTREGKSVWHCLTAHRFPKGVTTVIPNVIEATERMTDAKTGQMYLFPESEVAVWWTNLCESAEEVIELYHKHATSEQYHSELKTDMNFERLASGKFATNSLLLALATLAFNCLRVIGQTALAVQDDLPRRYKGLRLRLRTVIDELMRIGGRFVCHAGRKIIKLGSDCAWFTTFKRVYAALG